MNNFCVTLSFVFLPFFALLAMSMTVSPLGAMIYMRHEIMLSLAIPALANAVLTLLVGMGLSPNSKVILYSVIILVVLIFLQIMQRLLRKNSAQKREMILAGVFVLSNAVTYFVIHLFPKANSHLKYLLRGEVLTLGTGEFVYFLILLFISFVLGIVYRNDFFTLAIDESQLAVAGKTRAMNLFYIFISLIVTSAVILTGPLATTLFLIVPSLMVEPMFDGLQKYFVASAILGFSGTFIGFFISLFLDMPPVYMIALVIFSLGIILLLVRRIQLR